MSVENVVNHKEEFLNHLYMQLKELLDTSNINEDLVLEYDKMKLEQIKALNKLCDIDFKRFFHQIYNEEGQMNDAHKIVRLASLYDYNVAIASYGEDELNLFAEVTADILSEQYQLYDNCDVPLFSNREVVQNIVTVHPEFESQVNYVRAYMEGCQISMEAVYMR